MTDFLTDFFSHMPAALAALIVTVVLAVSHWALLARKPLGAEARLPRQLIMLGLTIVGVLVVILLLPMSESTRGQVLSLIGIVFTGVLGISSTTFVANAMAGLMLRMIKSFRPGDFVSVGEHFGRVSERGLFHTEMQTENRELCTLPNLYLITHPVTVVSASGTLIATSLSLGYDVGHERVTRLLKQAAGNAGLTDPFVHVRELGDYAVTYRVAGFSEDARQLLTARSRLCCAVLDALHGGGIEIVSPAFMNQRRLAEDVQVMPAARSYRRGPARPAPDDAAPESRIFDKAAEAGERESRREQLEQLRTRKGELAEALKQAEAGSTRTALETELAALGPQIEALETQVEADAEEEDRAPAELPTPGEEGLAGPHPRS